MVHFSWRESVRHRVVFLEDYDMALAQHLAAGVDVWLNNPRRPAEACGTSGMKMLANGGLHFSSLDGWWDEAYSTEVGWKLGDESEHNGAGDQRDAEELYRILEDAIVPEFYDRDESGIPRRWIQRIRESMTQLTPRFSSSRMLKEYVERTYLPAAEAFAGRAADGGRLAKEIEDWLTKIEEEWETLRFGNVKISGDGSESWRVTAQVYLGELSPEHVCLELCARPEGSPMEPLTVMPMSRQEPIHGAVNGYLYAVAAPDLRGPNDFVLRARPFHPKAFVPLETERVLFCARPAEVRGSA